VFLNNAFENINVTLDVMFIDIFLIIMKLKIQFSKISPLKITFTVAQLPVNVHNTDCCDFIVSHCLHNQGCVLAKENGTIAKNCDQS
jgi:hypothetical protein